MRARLLALGTCLLWLGLAADGNARPEKIRPGISYYSDDYVTAGLVRDIAEEKNLEEVYQFYSYYEAIYDDRKRVVTFKEYRRGDVIRVEKYRYDASGALEQRLLQRPGQADEVTTPGSTSDDARPAPAP